MTRLMYLIDGIEVSKKVWERRKIWGERADSNFEIIEREKPHAQSSRRRDY